MGTKKRISDEASNPRRKKAKLSDVRDQENELAFATVLPGEVDFPRGGGTSFTPVEYKSIRAEAIKELNEENVFKEPASKTKKTKASKKGQTMGKGQNIKQKKIVKDAGPRVEHLNYKRVSVGMKILCQVISVYPLALIVSLPNQLLGHVPITNVSAQLTSQLEAIDEALSDEGNNQDLDTLSHLDKDVELSHLFHPGQFLRAVVSSVRPAGVTDERVSSHLKDEIEKGSRRVELSLVPKQVNQGLQKVDLVKGFTITAAIKSVEDHGYSLDIGLLDVSGFLRFPSLQGERWRVGTLVDVTVVKLAEDGRTCLFTQIEEGKNGVTLKRISNVSSILPGALVEALVTSVSPSGLITQILGSFVGTLDLYHLPSDISSPTELSEGAKITARVLYVIAGSSPPQFALSAREHITRLGVKRSKDEGKPIQDSYPIGTMLSSVKVKRVEPERGLVVAVEDSLDGFVHISHTSDEHVPSLAINSGPWKLGTEHRARVTGFHPLDAILQLSLRPSVLSQKFLRVDDVRVGEVVKGTVNKLTDSALFVSINGNVDGMVWPMHFADIRLKHPERRFKPGVAIKARVLMVDSRRKRIMLTAKKSLVESNLPLICKADDAVPGLVTHGVVYKVLEKSLIVEFYSNVRAIVPLREVSDGSATSIADSYPIGKVVKVRLLSVDRGHDRITASIRQASGTEADMGNISDVEVGQVVSGVVKEVHRDNILLTLKKPKVHSLISIHNVANRRKVTVQELRSSLQIGEEMDNLVVVSRNLEKGIVIVANRPSSTQQNNDSPFNFDELKVGACVKGKVVKHGRHGAMIRFPGRAMGTLHPTDVSDNFEKQAVLPAIDSTIVASIVYIDSQRKHLVLSTRKSRLYPDTNLEITDREIGGLDDVKVGEMLRGIVKSVAEHGLFVTIGRDVDARVQIKELYNEYVKDWKAGFKVNQLVTGHILGVNTEKKQVEMSLRSGSSKREELSFGDLEIGQKIDGRIKKVEDFGIFIQIMGSKLSGLCHKSEIADNKDADINVALRNFREGDSVKAIILGIDAEKRRISLGLKPSYFVEDADLDERSEDMEGIDADVDMIADTSGGDNEASEIGELNQDDVNEEHGCVVVDSYILDMPSTENTVDDRSVPGPVLSLLGFQWNPKDKVSDSDELATSDEEEFVRPEKRRRKKTIEQDLTADLQTRTPESVADFERHLLASPNSSFLWIQYMSFQLQLSEIEKAKEVGRRALQAINIREEQEKLNVWIALLNLEITYGTDESVEVLFKEAARYNDSKTIHLRLAAIYDQSDKLLKAEEQYKRTCKKFGKSSKVWTLFGEHYFRRGILEDARKLLPRSLQSLEKRKHLKTISKFAQLEYKLGEPERGKTIFEGIIDSHPKRWDIWLIYFDMEASQKNIQGIRSIFERVFVHKMTSHKAKAFFKKWLDIERRIGDEEGQSMVKEKAIEWTRRTSNGQ